MQQNHNTITMKESFELKESFQVPPAKIYAAWLDSVGHTAMTGGEADCNAQVGGSFTAWDGYISGTNLELIPNQKIVQSWRSTQFAPEDEDSELTIQLEETAEGTLLTLIHQNIPEGQTQYKLGWINHYFTCCLCQKVRFVLFFSLVTEAPIDTSKSRI